MKRTENYGFEIHIANLVPIKLTHIQWADLRAAILEHERNGFRDGWTRMGSVRVIEVGISAREIGPRPKRGGKK
jgi:hypothetical protein